jgi:hypothetical protein
VQAVGRVLRLETEAAVDREHDPATPCAAAESVPGVDLQARLVAEEHERASRRRVRQLSDFSQFTRRPVEPVVQTTSIVLSCSS